MWRFVAPAGAPVEFSQIVRSAFAAASGRDSGDGGFHRLAEQLKVRDAFGVASGRSALAAILRAQARARPGRGIVAIPAYTCFSVPAAVVRAGLKVMPVEIDPDTLDYNFEELEKVPAESLLAVVSSNLFGLVNNGRCISSMARARGAFFIDDAAQALGASRNGDSAGMMGDAGFYSFGRGKALPAMEGAVIVTNSDQIASALREEIKPLSSGSFMHSLKMLIQMLGFALFLSPRLYWIPNSLPFLSLGATEFEPDFPERRMSALVREMIEGTLSKLENFNETRRRNAAVLARALEDCPGFKLPRMGEDCVPNYVRFPVISSDAAMRDRAVSELCAAGIGATAFYPSAICDIPGIEAHMATTNYHCPAAEDLSRRLLTLPTHAYVTEKDLQTMIATLRKAGSE